MRFTYSAAAIFFISTVWAVPINNITASSDSGQIDLYARDSKLSSLFRPYVKKLPHKAPSAKSSSPQALVKSATSKGTPPGHSAHGNEAGHSTIIVDLWSANDYRGLQSEEFPFLQGITILDHPCTAAQKTHLEQSIKTVITQATRATGNAGLRIKPGLPTFRFEGTCQAQWLPVYNLFYFYVENGEGGACEDSKCFGYMFLQSGHGRLENLDNGQEFYDTTDETDFERFSARSAELRA